MTLDRFISIHIPKTGGTVFRRRVLHQLYPKDMKMMYGEFWGTKPFGWQYRPYSVIHGHFLAQRYAPYKRPFITWVSLPLDRMISHYTYSVNRRAWLVGGAVARNKEKTRVKTFSEFCVEYQNFMTTIMIGPDVSLDRYAFVGVLEYWRESMLEFGELIGKDTSEYAEIESERTNYDTYYYTPSECEVNLFNELNKKDCELWWRYARRFM